MRISDWSSDVCSSDLLPGVGCQIVAVVGRNAVLAERAFQPVDLFPGEANAGRDDQDLVGNRAAVSERDLIAFGLKRCGGLPKPCCVLGHHARHRTMRGRRFEDRSEEHTSELQSLMRISYAVFCLKKKKQSNNTTNQR